MATSATTHSFNLSTIQKGDKEGDNWPEQYGGEFRVRRPTIADRQRISMLEAGQLNRHGVVDAETLDISNRNLNYIFSFFAVVGEEVPDWFKQEGLYEEDEEAVFAAFMEVSRWLDSFRVQ